MRAKFAHRLRHWLSTKAIMPAMPRALFIQQNLPGQFRQPIRCVQAIYATYRTVLRVASLHIYLT
jgi:hypothetical protein